MGNRLISSWVGDHQRIPAVVCFAFFTYIFVLLLCITLALICSLWTVLKRFETHVDANLFVSISKVYLHIDRLFDIIAVIRIPIAETADDK
jgi:hypothetical protein